MTPPRWANYPLALLFLSARAGIPSDDFAAIHAYLPAKAALATDGEPETGPATT